MSYNNVESKSMSQNELLQAVGEATHGKMALPPKPDHYVDVVFGVHTLRVPKKVELACRRSATAVREMREFTTAREALNIKNIRDRAGVKEVIQLLDEEVKKLRPIAGEFTQNHFDVCLTHHEGKVLIKGRNYPIPA